MEEIKMYESVQSLAHELRLFGIHQSAERRCLEAQSESLHPAELLRLILEDERDRRKQMTAKRLSTRAKFRSGAQMEEWDYSYQRGISKAKMKELAIANFYYKKQNLIIVGKTGLGKTHLAIGIGNQLCKEGISVAFFSTNLFLDEAASEKAAGRYLKFLKRITKNEVLIFDDFALRTYGHDEANIFCEVLEERYQKGVNIITSQVAPEGWGTLFEDSVISEAIFDRLKNPAELVELKGDSYRKLLKELDGKRKP